MSRFGTLPRRLVHLVIIGFGITLVTFFLLRLIPGDPALRHGWALPSDTIRALSIRAKPPPQCRESNAGRPRARSRQMETSVLI